MTETPPTNAQSVTATNHDSEAKDAMDRTEMSVIRNIFSMLKTGAVSPGNYTCLLALVQGWIGHTDIRLCGATKLCLLPVDHLGDHFPRSIEFPHEP